MAQEQFVDTAAEMIVSMPQDLKATLRIVEDQDVSEEGRVLVSGAILHALSNANAIPGMRGILAHVGDALVLRLALERAEKGSPEAFAGHREDSPELFAPLNDQLTAARAFLGDLIGVLETAVDGVTKINHQGYTAKQCAVDDEAGRWLYDAVNEAIVEQLEFDEDEVHREARQVEQILPHLRSRLAASGT